MSLLARPAPSGGGRVLPQLDALRGAAILAVFVQHLGDRFFPFLEARAASALPAATAPWALTILHHAWWGVDLFFVLSGFSLAQGYVSAFAAGRAGPAKGVFLARRAARILPAFFVAIAVMIALRPRVVLQPGFPAALGAHLALLQGYVTPGGIVLIGAAWSLTTEAHFYLLLPLLARPLLDPLRPARRWLTAGALCALAWGSRALLHAWILEPGVHSALLEASQRRWISSRLDQFVLGALAAVLHAAIRTSPRAAEAARRAPLGLALSVAALVVAFRLEGALYLDPHGSWPYALLSLATAALVLSASLVEGRALAWIAPLPLCALGVVSYGVFLYHQLALGLAGHALGPEQSTWAALARNAALGLALAIAMGFASWTLIERPALRAAAARLRAR
ncbi:MAG: acyltransferase family protein [Byssovorax sp.]